MSWLFSSYLKILWKIKPYLMAFCSLNFVGFCFSVFNFIICKGICSNKNLKLKKMVLTYAQIWTRPSGSVNNNNVS